MDRLLFLLSGGCTGVVDLLCDLKKTCLLVSIVLSDSSELEEISLSCSCL